jgi:SAM-dependent methyltransferase
MPLPVPPVARVKYVDRMTVDDLRRHYPELSAYPLVDVDIVDDGERLSAIADASVDFVIANHFVEHTEDPIGTLSQHVRVLRPGGVLYLAVPDKRRTFDIDREITSIEHLLRDHDDGPGWSRGAHYLDWARLVDRVPEETLHARARELDESGYSIHFHVWDPEAFLVFLDHCRRSLGLPFTVEASEEVGGELIAVLRKAAT